MCSGALRQDEQTDNDEGGNDGGGDWPAERQPAVADGLVEEVADGGAERPRQDEGRPEQRHARHAGPEIQCRDDRKRGAEYQCAAFIAETASVGDPVTERGAQRLREG